MQSRSHARSLRSPAMPSRLATMIRCPSGGDRLFPRDHPSSERDAALLHREDPSLPRIDPSIRRVPAPIRAMWASSAGQGASSGASSHGAAVEGRRGAGAAATPSASASIGQRVEPAYPECSEAKCGKTPLGATVTPSGHPRQAPSHLLPSLPDSISVIPIAFRFSVCPGKEGGDFRSPTPQSPPVGRGRSIGCPMTYSPPDGGARGGRSNSDPPSVPAPISCTRWVYALHGRYFAKRYTRLVQIFGMHG